LQGKRQLSYSTYNGNFIRRGVFWNVDKRALIVAVIMMLPVFSGCVYLEKIEQFLMPPPQYEWKRLISVEDTFGWVDVVNKELAKISDYPIYVSNETKYLNIYIHVEFSNPINPDIESLSQGHLNFTILKPDGENITKTYCTATKVKTFDDYFYFENPQEGQWNIIIRVFGYGKYRMVAKAYQPVS